MPFLDEILAATEQEIATAKAVRSEGELKRMLRDAPPLRSFRSALSGKFGLIAEIKKQSPSGGQMRPENVDSAPEAYARSPVVHALSVLTNATYFAMKIDDLARIKAHVGKPVLRKDFMLCEYQVYEARAFGADAILLMACVLDAEGLKRLFHVAQELGLDALFEVHTEEEIEQIPEGAKIYGVNSRKFKDDKRWEMTRQLLRQQQGHSSHAPDLSVELQTFDLIDKLPAGAIKIAESGVHANKVTQIRDKGYNAVLVGTSLLKNPSGTEKALLEFEQALNSPDATSASDTRNVELGARQAK